MSSCFTRHFKRGRQSCCFSSIFPNWKKSGERWSMQSSLSSPLSLKRGNHCSLWSNRVGSSLLNAFTMSFNLCKKSREWRITVSSLQMRKLRLKTMNALTKGAIATKCESEFHLRLFVSKTCATASFCISEVVPWKIWWSLRPASSLNLFPKHLIDWDLSFRWRI